MITFSAKGHPLISASHRKTLEFTKEKDVTEAGDCIVGVEADFDTEELRGIASAGGMAELTMSTGDEQFKCRFLLHKAFNDGEELVIRKSGFLSSRTLGIGADKASSDIPEGLRERLKAPGSQVKVVIENVEEAAEQEGDKRTG